MTSFRYTKPDAIPYVRKASQKKNWSKKPSQEYQEQVRISAAQAGIIIPKISTKDNSKQEERIVDDLADDLPW